MKTLLVEDSAETRMVLEAVLKARAYDVDAFERAEDAWQACQSRTYDLAVLDWMLPGMDGLQLCENIRSLDWGDRALVLVVTARSKIFDLQSVLEAGADDYISKPLDPELLDVRLTIAERRVELLAERRRTEEAKARALRRLETLHEIDRAILASRSSVEIAESALERLLTLTGLTDVNAVEFDFDHDEALIVATAGSEGRTIDVGSRIPLQAFDIDALRRGDMSIFEPAQCNVTHDQLRGRTMVCFPLIVRGELIGSLNLANRPGTDVEDEHVHIAHEVATSLAVGIQNARLNAELVRLATTDDLTGTHNRRKLFDLGAREVLRSKRFSRPLSAIMLDIDHFKDINDAYGHATGDRVLLCVAHCCQRAIREIDILGRYGGEEFAILLPEAGLDDALEVAERLRCDVEVMTVPGVATSPDITVSLGVAKLGNGTNDLPTLLSHADAAMYAAKRAGRNKVKLYSDDSDS